MYSYRFLVIDLNIVFYLRWKGVESSNNLYIVQTLDDVDQLRSVGVLGQNQARTLDDEAPHVKARAEELVSCLGIVVLGEASFRPHLVGRLEGGELLEAALPQARLVTPEPT